ncbi:MAG TPA: gamma-glutamyltransferase [Gemmatimonadaceae bacterium]|nr:gamma-glutamyltransferase [Gemmatimonadaceae bacterium]
MTRGIPLLPLAVFVANATVAMAQSTVIPMRPDVSGWEVAVTSDHPLASEAGAAVLRKGGNAIDAAVTMAAVLSVVRPHMNGPGGDGFMLYRDGRTGKVYALNGSGAAGAKATPTFFAERGLKTIPGSGILSVSVPGAVRMWEDALTRFGTIRLAAALAPAIGYATRGFPVSNRLSSDIGESSRLLERDSVLARIYLPGGEAPKPGTILRQPELGRTLQRIATGGARAFYRGPIAAQIAAYMESEGGLLTAADLAGHRSQWQDPIETTYRGQRVLAFPPNTQGVTLLQQLNLAELFDLGQMGHNSVSYVHTLVEGSKIAYADRDALVADPRFAQVPVADLIGKRRATENRSRIGDRATQIVVDTTRDGNGDTIYLGVVDRQGNAVSWIQSNFAAFGSGKGVPGLGLILHNRGSLYSLDPKHPNIVAPGKRPYHTLSPAMVLNGDGSLAAVLGTPGGDGQTQTILQILNNVVVFGMSAQQAVEAPRWRSYGRRVGIEPGVGTVVRDSLTARGHTVTIQQPGAEFGGAQMIRILPSGARQVGSDFRREAYGIAW